MSGDYSRKRFNPEKHYQGVLRQQGRVDLDADWNEYIDLQDRRWRAETIDVIGRCGVPKETPDGFKIASRRRPTDRRPGTDLRRWLILRKTMARLRSSMPRSKSTMAPPRCRSKISPTEQVPVTVPAGARSLVYLDVWRREVTHLQDA